MNKNFRTVSKDFMIHLLKSENDGAGLYRENDSIIRIDTENYSFHVCNFGVMTAEKIDHTGYKCTAHDFSVLFDSISAQMMPGRTIDIDSMLK